MNKCTHRFDVALTKTAFLAHHTGSITNLIEYKCLLINYTKTNHNFTEQRGTKMEFSLTVLAI